MLEYITAIFAAWPLARQTAPKGLHERFPEYFIPTTADASSWHWDRQPQSFIDTVLAEFKSGGCFLMGEYEIRHYPSPMQWRAGQFDRDVAIAFETGAVHDLFRTRYWPKRPTP